MDCLPFGGFKMAGLSDLDVCLDVNEPFRFIWRALTGSGNLSNMFDGMYIMYLSSYAVYHQASSTKHK